MGQRSTDTASHGRTDHRLVIVVLLLGLAVWLGGLVGPTTAAVREEGTAAASHPKDEHADNSGHEAAGHHEPTAIEHVLDSDTWHLFMSFGPEIHLPKVFGFQITKFMILELIAAGIILAIYIPLCRRLQNGDPPKGAWDNTFESILTFLRDQVARPSIGEESADRFVPFLWAIFLFILTNNLLGLVPFGGSATASIYVTLGLAICVFFAIHGSAIAKMGFVHYLESLWPHFDVPFGMGYILKPFVFVIEVFGVLVRNVVLAIRLFANMFAGHMVLATILIFIYMAGHLNPVLWATVTVSSVLGMVALNLLEIFVAFLQSFIFTFLSALFIGLAINPEH